MKGTASPEATVSVNEQLVNLDALGEFETTRPLKLQEGPNLIEVIASDLAGEVRTKVLTIIYTEDEDGLFGRVTSITTPSPGLTVITLDSTTAGEQTVEAAESTTVRIPGRETASAADLSQGDTLAVSGARIHPGLISATRILVKPSAPSVHAHVTGSVVGGTENQVSLMDGHGNVITADPPPGGGAIGPGQLVTAVVLQDLKTGALSITGIESAGDKMDRLISTLEGAALAGAAVNEQILGQRLQASATGYLTTLQEILHRVNPDLKFLYTQSFDRSFRSHENTLSRFGLGAPTIRVSGILEDIDRTGAEPVAFVAPREGPQVALQIKPVTIIRLFGGITRVDNLELGQRIESLYDPKTGTPHTIDVIFPALKANEVRSLLAEARRGELEGTLTDIQPSAVPPLATVRLGTGREVLLTITSQTRIQVREQPAEPQDLSVGVRVKVRYDPTISQALDIETFDVKTGQAFVSGVLNSFIPKFREGIRIPGSPREGNISITYISGEQITLNVTESTVIERDGLRMNIAAIKLGDLVRPTSSYNTQSRALVKLSLRGANLQGTLRGKFTTPSGRDYVTISTDELELVTVRVTPTTTITKNDSPASFATLEVGDRVASGRYNPQSLESSRLVVQPPKTLRLAGTIADLNKVNGIVTVATTTGESISLVLPGKPGIVTVDGVAGSILDLKVGDRVEVAFYRPDRVIVKIAIVS